MKQLKGQDIHRAYCAIEANCWPWNRLPESDKEKYNTMAAILNQTLEKELPKHTGIVQGQS